MEMLTDEKFHQWIQSKRKKYLMNIILMRRLSTHTHAYTYIHTQRKNQYNLYPVEEMVINSHTLSNNSKSLRCWASF